MWGLGSSARTGCCSMRRVCPGHAGWRASVIESVAAGRDSARPRRSWHLAHELLRCICCQQHRRAACLHMHLHPCSYKCPHTRSIYISMHMSAHISVRISTHMSYACLNAFQYERLFAWLYVVHHQLICIDYCAIVAIQVQSL